MPVKDNNLDRDCPTGGMVKAASVAFSIDCNIQTPDE